MADDTRRLAGHRPLRFLAVTAPATLVCLGITAGIFLGYFSIALTSALPIQVASTRGDADQLAIAIGTNGALTELDMSKDQPVAIVRVTSARLDDLCLQPRLHLPLLGDLAFIKIASSDPVDLGEVALAADDGALTGLILPETSIGVAAAQTGLPVAPGSWAVTTEQSDGEVVLSGLDMAAYGLVLREGMTMRSVRFGASSTEMTC